MLNLHDYRSQLEEACSRYEKTAPTVAAHCNDLYIRMNESGDRVTLRELARVQLLWVGSWMGPMSAANLIYKLRNSLGMDTTGHAGF